MRVYDYIAAKKVATKLGQSIISGLQHFLSLREAVCLSGLRQYK